jgi:hypothetical protein
MTEIGAVEQVWGTAGLEQERNSWQVWGGEFHEWRQSYDIPRPNGESLEMCAERSVEYFKKKVRTNQWGEWLITLHRIQFSLLELIFTWLQVGPESIFFTFTCNEAASALGILFIFFSFSSTKDKAAAALAILFGFFSSFTFGEAATALSMLVLFFSLLHLQ